MKISVASLHDVITEYSQRNDISNILKQYQWFDEGIDATGNKVRTHSSKVGKYGIYNRYYERYKERSGYGVRTFNLKFSGNFYNSLKAKVTNDGFIFETSGSDYIKKIKAVHPLLFKPSESTIDKFIRGYSRANTQGIQPFILNNIHKIILIKK